MTKVMIVDDSEAIRMGLSLLLRTQGYTAILAGDGNKALEIIGQDCPDLVVLDVSMPGMDGMTVLEAIRETPRCEYVPVLMYSAVDDEGLRRRAARLNAEFVCKGTMSWDDLAERIKGCLAHHPTTYN